MTDNTFTKKLAIVIFLTVAPYLFLEIGVIFYWLFLFGMEPFIVCHAMAWNITSLFLLTVLSIGLMIAGIYVQFIQGPIPDVNQEPFSQPSWKRYEEQEQLGDY